MSLIRALGRALRRSTLSTQVLIGVIAGVVVGLFFGDAASVLQGFADAYVKLLQMTVLPYITVSIVAGLGGLSLQQAGRLGLRLGGILALLGVITLGVVFLFPLMFPAHQSASFFSTTLVEPREAFDIVGLYIPTNPFNSLANNVVPAVVVFSITLGVSLISVPNRERLLDVLAVAGHAITRATNFVILLTPYGVFAIAAVAAGTLGVDDLEKLEVYVVSYTVLSLLLSLWVLPGLVAALTPIPHRVVLMRIRAALITAFMTTSLFAVLPMLTEEAKALLEEYAGADESVLKATDIIVPTSFNFPHAGKLLALSFVLFASWFEGAGLQLRHYPRLAFSGLFVLFGNVNLALPFLLDLFRVPADTFQLFLATGVVNARFGTVAAAVHTVVVALLGSCALAGLLTFNTRKLLRFTGMTALLGIAAVGSTRALLAVTLSDAYDKDRLLTSMQPLHDRGPEEVFASAAAAPALPPINGSVLGRIQQRGAIRVGYLDDSLPYAFFNARGNLVGFDIEMAHQLARDLHVRLEFVPVPRRALTEGLDPQMCDIVMSGVVVTSDRALNVLFSVPYLDETIAFVVPDHLRTEFLDWSDIKAMPHLRLGVPPIPYYLDKIREELPDAEIVPAPNMDAMFSRADPTIVGFVLTAERGSAYTLLHPEYSVAVPQPEPSKVPLAYVIAGHDQALETVVNLWIDLKHKDGTIDQLFSHWVLGRDIAGRQPRWSIGRDVLHWLH